MRYISALLLLLLVSSASALDPPVKLWEKQYYGNYSGCFFSDMELTPEKNLFITGTAWDWAGIRTPHKCAFLIDENGEVIWDVTAPFYGVEGADGSILADGSYIITGTAVVDPNSTYSLFIMKIDQSGTIEWTKIFDYPETREEGYGITCLPDGGFAVCGRVHGTGSQQGQAWILRTDAQGDTLWTRTWGTHPSKSTVHYGKSILFSNNELCILAKGTDDTLTTNGAHLLFYSLEGNYLRGIDYPDLYWDFPVSFCIPSCGGYTFVTDIHPVIRHTDQYGQTLWTQSIYVTPNDWHKGYCIRQTMDSGYIFCGWDGYFEYEPDGNLVDYQEGWLARFDSEGNELWNINNTISVDHHFYSCLQLPEGGYIACGAYNVWENRDDASRGSTGFLVRYAPETGIASPDPDDSLSLEISPNPCSALLTVNFSLPEAGNASVRIYDLSGRLISTVANGLFPAGSNSVDWVVPDDASSGCYLIQYNAGLGSVTETIALIK